MRTKNAIEYACIFGVLVMLAVQFWSTHRGGGREGGTVGRWVIVALSVVVSAIAVVMATTTTSPARRADPVVTVIVDRVLLDLAVRLSKNKKARSVLDALTFHPNETYDGNKLGFMCAKLTARAMVVQSKTRRWGFVGLIKVDTKITEIVRFAFAFLKTHRDLVGENLSEIENIVAQAIQREKDEPIQNPVEFVLGVHVIDACMRFISKHDRPQSGKMVLMIAIGGDDDQLRRLVVESCVSQLQPTPARVEWKIVCVSAQEFATPTTTHARRMMVDWMSLQSVKEWQPTAWESADVFMLYSDFSNVNIVEWIFGNVTPVALKDPAKTVFVVNHEPDYGVAIDPTALDIHPRRGRGSAAAAAASKHVLLVNQTMLALAKEIHQHEQSSSSLWDTLSKAADYYDPVHRTVVALTPHMFMAAKKNRAEVFIIDVGVPIPDDLLHFALAVGRLTAQGKTENIENLREHAGRIVKHMPNEARTRSEIWYEVTCTLCANVIKCTLDHPTTEQAEDTSSERPDIDPREYTLLITIGHHAAEKATLLCNLVTEHENTRINILVDDNVELEPHIKKLKNVKSIEYIHLEDAKLDPEPQALWFVVASADRVDVVHSKVGPFDEVTSDKSVLRCSATDCKTVN